MFWERFIPQRFLTKSEVCVLEVIYAEGSTKYVWALFQNRKGKLELVNEGISNNQWPSLPAPIIKRKIPVLLMLTGANVISKKADLDVEAVSNWSMVSKTLLPGINQEEFYIQSYASSKNACFFGICRKVIVDDFIGICEREKVNLVMVFLGAGAITGLKPLWGNLNGFDTEMYSFEILNGDLSKIVLNTEKKGTEKLQLGDLKVPASLAFLYSGALSYLLQLPLLKYNPTEFIKLEDQHLQKNKLAVLLAGTISILFLISILNLVVFTSNYARNASLEQELALYQSKNDEINQLLTDYSQNKELIEHAGMLGAQRMSEYADKVAMSLPSEIVLKDLDFHPKIEKDETDSLQNFHSGLILIKGYCEKSLIVNDWVNQLKGYDFVKAVVLKQFAYTKETQRPNFLIEVQTK